MSSVLQRRGLMPIESLVLIAALAAYFALACYRIAAPGLYADELLFGPPAIRALGQCGIEANVTIHVGKCFPIYLDPPYLGALKAWIYAPVFALFDPSPESIRWPAIALSALALALLFGLTRRALGTGFAVAITTVCALDPVFIFHSRFDWGPFVLSNLCKLAFLAALLAWLRGGRPRQLAITLAFGLLGLYDKLNFLWIIAAFGVATLAAYPDTLWRHLRGSMRGHVALVAVFCVVLTLVLWKLVLPATQLGIRYVPQHLDLAEQFGKLVMFYNDAFAATFARNWMFVDSTPLLLWPCLLLLGQGVATLVLALLRPWRHGETLAAAWRLLLFVSVAIVALLLQMLITRQLAGAHHLVALWPLPTLHLFLLVDLGARSLRARRTSVVATDEDPRLQIVSVLALILIALAIPRHLDMLAGWRGEHGFNGRFDPKMAELGPTLSAIDADVVIAADWGFHQQMATVAPPSQRPRFHEWWAIFAQPWESDVKRNVWLHDTYLKHGSSIWLTLVPGKDAFAELRTNIPQFLEHWGGCLRLERTLPGSDAKPLYQIWRYRPGESCPVPDLNASEPMTSR